MLLYLHRDDIEYLNSVSDKIALQIMQDVRDTYNLPKTRYISISAYCKYFMVEREDVLESLKLKRAG